MIPLLKLSRERNRFQQIRSRIEAYWLDRMVEELFDKVPGAQVRGTVRAVLRNEQSGMELVIPGLNIVTNEGDLYYAQQSADEQPDDAHFTTGAATAFDGIMELYNGASAAPAKTNNRSDLVGLVSGSGKVMDTGYPQTNDADGDNTGALADAVTYRVSYATGEANATNIADVILTNPSPTTNENLLSHAEFSTPFSKTSSDTLKTFVNHELLGV